MNERIKELALLSGQNLIPFMDPRVKDMISERFAELIVQECIDYCGENLSKTVGDALKIHFGVAE